MSKLNITQQTMVTRYEYSGDGAVTAQGEYRVNSITGKLEAVSGTVYDNGQYIGDYNGYQRNDAVKYSLSEMTKEQSDVVWAVIADIEPQITPEEEGGEA